MPLAMTDRSSGRWPSSLPIRRRRSWPAPWPPTASCSLMSLHEGPWRGAGPRPGGGRGGPDRSARGPWRATPSRPSAPPWASSGSWRRASPTWSRVAKSPGSWSTSTTWAGSTPAWPTVLDQGRPFRRRRRGLPGRRRHGPPGRRPGTLWPQPAPRRRQLAAEPGAAGGGRAAAGRGLRPGPPVASAPSPAADRPGGPCCGGPATWPGARADLRRVLDEAPAQLDPQNATPVLAGLAEAALWDGRPADGRAAVADGLKVLATSDEPYWVGELCRSGLAVAAALAEQARARHAEGPGAGRPRAGRPAGRAGRRPRRARGWSRRRP